MALAQEGQERVPGRALRVDERRGIAGAVANEVGSRIFGRVGLHLGHPRRDAVDRGIDEPRQRHARRIDLFVLRHPLTGDGFGQGFGRQQQRGARRGAQGLAVEQHRKALRLRRDGDCIVKARQLLGLAALGHDAQRIALGRGDEQARREIVFFLSHRLKPPDADAPAP